MSPYNSPMRPLLAACCSGGVAAAFFGALAFAPQDVQRQIGAKAPDFKAVGTDGKSHTLASLSKVGDVHLYFIKIGCPVNHRAAPHFKKVAETYGPKGNLVGVINGSAAQAKSWAKEYGAKFLILADPDLKIIRSYGALHSPWALSVAKGKVAKVWDEGSATALTAINKRVAQTAGVKVVAMNFDGAPAGGG